MLGFNELISETATWYKRVLNRGFAVIRSGSNDKIISRGNKLHENSLISIEFYDNKMPAKITKN